MQIIAKTMNKIYPLLLFFGVFSFSLSAQTATDEAITRACDCFNSLNFSAIDYKYINSKADSCLQEALFTNLTGVMKENNISAEDNKAMLVVAERIGTTLSDSCKGFQSFSTRLAQQKVEEIKKNNPSEMGLLYELKTNGTFPVFTIITKDKQILDFIWFREFDGSARFFNGIKEYKNTIVSIVFQEIELFDIDSKQYKVYKEILLLEEGTEISDKEWKDWVGGVKKGRKL